jgi:hypothetical protein
MEDKIKEAISVMKKAYDTYVVNAQKNIDKDEATYWHWTGIAEGTRRSWELLEEMFGLEYESDVDCDGRCLNCDNFDTDDCPDRH